MQKGVLHYKDYEFSLFVVCGMVVNRIKFDS